MLLPRVVVQYMYTCRLGVRITVRDMSLINDLKEVHLLEGLLQEPK